MASVIILATLMNAVLIMVTVVEGMKRRRRPYGCVCAGAGPFVVNQMSTAMSCVGITQPIRFTPSRARARGGLGVGRGAEQEAEEGVGVNSSQRV